jgi:hypothetical protein
MQNVVKEQVNCSLGVKNVGEGSLFSRILVMLYQGLVAVAGLEFSNSFFF